MSKIKRLLSDSAPVRWFVLVLLAMLTFATYWFQDFFSGIKPLMESQMGFTSSDFGLLISSTTWANLAGMIILGGIILDRWGIRISGIIFGGLATLGAGVTALAASGYFGNDPDTMLSWMMVGRILFGIGLETVCVLVSRTIVKWFKGHELALAFAINMGFGRLGSALGTAFSIDIGGGLVSPAVNFAATLIAIALIGFLVYLIFDIKIDKQVGAQKTGNEAEEEKFKFSDLVKLLSNRSFIFIALLCVTFYAAVFPFIQYAPDLLVNKFGFTLELPDMSSMTLWQKLGAIFSNGPKVASLIPLGTIIFTPIFGSIVDKKGKAASLMILGSFLLIFAHLSLSVFNSVALGYLGLFSLGIAFSLVPAAMWPSVAKIVAESRLGTAYATMFTIQNYGLAAFFWGIGKVLDLTNTETVTKIVDTNERLSAEGFNAAEISIRIKEMQISGLIPYYDYTIPVSMLVVLGAISIWLAFLLKKADKKQGYGLEMPSGHNNSPEVLEAENIGDGK
nr:MFS transporter [Bacteroidota bacterium]